MTNEAAKILMGWNEIVGGAHVPPVRRAVLPMSAAEPIPPGRTAVVTASPRRSTFRPERLVISPHSFPLSRPRLFWTWPIVAIGTALATLVVALAKLLRVDLNAPRERAEYLTDLEIADLAALENLRESDGDSDGFTEQDIHYDAENRPYRFVPIPFNRRERFVVIPIARTARRLGDVRINWQYRQLAQLIIRQITIGARGELAKGGLPGDMFMMSAIAIDTFVDFRPCELGQEIAIEIENRSRRDCRLMMSLVGTAAEPST